ncbi:dienelactone hydrolase [Bdellovibrio bacteriovorus]|uniref:Dienelactone hydrolase n=1 Tax=Bdellovibrio bacteriovorus TaxID=959 RepID=A0A150WEW9_BDEBC|nr:dienelactone hydrolase family protein [Bdellovibrio bacteriovorus]KYG61473.1 dienelactone hydrolase [Bdellovibrio bacteriovorus]
MKALWKTTTLVLATIFSATAAHAAIKSEAVEYKDGKTVLEGYIVYDDSWTTPRPAVMIVHQWMGLTDHEKQSAEKLANQGYVAFAIDLYGKGNRPGNMAEAGGLAGTFKSNRQMFRDREKAAFEFLKKNKKVDSKKVVIAGYCLGGTGALEAARGGIPVVGAVSFHGGLSADKPEKTKNLKAKLLVLHGAVDPNVPPKEVEGFMKEMNDAKADYQFIAYSGAVHAFTQKESGNDPSKGAAYNEAADRRSWVAFMDFLDEVIPVAK